MFELMQRRCAGVFAVLVGAGQLTECLADADANHCSSHFGGLSEDSSLIQVNSRPVKIQVPDMSAVYNNQLKETVQEGSVKEAFTAMSSGHFAVPDDMAEVSFTLPLVPNATQAISRSELTTEQDPVTRVLVAELEDIGFGVVQAVYANESLRDRNPVAFVHLHKSAGSMMCALARTAGERIVSPSANCNEESSFTNDDYHVRNALSVGSVARPTPSCEDRQRHMEQGAYSWFSIERELDDGDMCEHFFTVVGVMREPVARLESLVNFDEHRLLGFAPESLIRCIKERSCPMRSEWEHFDNFYVRVLAGSTAMRLPPGGVTQEHFDRAQRVLRRFHAMVPLEQLFTGDVAEHMDKTLGWHVSGDHRYNPSTKTISFSAEERQEILAMNAFDVQLYNEVLNR